MIEIEVEKSIDESQILIPKKKQEQLKLLKIQ
jgi:hypothetical protein